MTSEVPRDEDCIVISELSDENGVDEKSSGAMSVSESFERQTVSSKSREEKMKCDYVETECHLPVQTGTALQSTSETSVNSSCDSQNLSKH